MLEGGFEVFRRQVIKLLVERELTGKPGGVQRAASGLAEEALPPRIAPGGSDIRWRTSAVAAFSYNTGLDCRFAVALRDRFSYFYGLAAAPPTEAK